MLVSGSIASTVALASRLHEPLATFGGDVRRVASLHCCADYRGARVTVPGTRASAGVCAGGEPEMGEFTPEERECFAEISRFWVAGGLAKDPDAPRVVYGYALAAAHEPSSPARMRAAIAAFADDRGLLLGTTFIDESLPDGAAGRPGLNALLSVLQLPSTHGAVVADVQDLAPEPDDFQVLAEAIARTGSTLYVLRKSQVWRPSSVQLSECEDRLLAPEVEGWRAARAERQKYRWILWGTEDE